MRILKDDKMSPLFQEVIVASLVTPKFVLLLYQTCFTVTQSGYHFDIQGEENSLPVSICALLVALYDLCFGLRFVFL